MQHVTTASELLDREFLAIRARLIDLAAMLDRIDRGGNPAGAAADDRRETIRRCLAVLADEAADRATQVQMLFSLPYAGPASQLPTPHSPLPTS
jgi:hypothetical protein